MQQKLIIFVLVRLAEHLILIDGSNKSRRVFLRYFVLCNSVGMISLLLHILDIFGTLHEFVLVKIISQTAQRSPKIDRQSLIVRLKRLNYRYCDRVFLFGQNTPLDDLFKALLDPINHHNDHFPLPVQELVIKTVRKMQLSFLIFEHALVSLACCCLIEALLSLVSV